MIEICAFASHNACLESRNVVFTTTAETFSEGEKTEGGTATEKDKEEIAGSSAALQQREALDAGEQAEAEMIKQQAKIAAAMQHRANQRVFKTHLESALGHLTWVPRAASLSGKNPRAWKKRRQPDLLDDANDDDDLDDGTVRDTASASSSESEDENADPSSGLQQSSSAGTDRKRHGSLHQSTMDAEQQQRVQLTWVW